MYYITELLSGKWQCYCRIQDGKEIWEKESRQAAIHSIIQAARVLNGGYILESDVIFNKEYPKQIIISPEDKKLLDDIRRGEKKVYNHNDKVVMMKITDEECEVIRRIREGELSLSRNVKFL